jgi:pimeloyl-ACP methyl ester carboxylesterase
VAHGSRHTGGATGIFEKSGHLPAYEEPEKYHDVLEDFLER